MQFKENLKRHLRPEEAITLPFLLLMIVLYGYFPLRPTFNVPLVNGTLAIGGLYALLIGIGHIMHLVREKTSRKDSLRKALAFARDWGPIIAILCIYENLHDLIPYFNRQDRDPELLRLDTMLFGEPHLTIRLQAYISPILTDLMVVAYASLFLYLPVLGFTFYLGNRTRALRLLMLSFTITAFAGFIGYTMVPAVGPAYHLAGAYTRNLSGRYAAPIVQPVIRNLSIFRDVFPSLHVGYSTVFLGIAYRYSKGFFWLFLPLVLCLWISTVYLRYHYVVDLFAGFALALAALAAGEWIYKRWYGE